MMNSKMLLALIGFLVVSGASSTASALYVDCATAGCLGGTYELDVISLGGDSYQATYTIDTSGVFSVDATVLNDLEFKVANDYANVLLRSGPSGTVTDGPLNGAGCNGNNGSFICVDLAPELALGSSYTWTLTFESTALIGEDEWHVGARYTSPDHRRGWVISETAAPVPEPTAALLFAAGLIVAGQVSRRTKN